MATFAKLGSIVLMANVLPAHKVRSSAMECVSLFQTTIVMLVVWLAPAVKFVRPQVDSVSAPLQNRSAMENV